MSHTGLAWLTRCRRFRFSRRSGTSRSRTPASSPACRYRASVRTAAAPVHGPVSGTGTGAVPRQMARRWRSCGPGRTLTRPRSPHGAVSRPCGRWYVSFALNGPTPDSSGAGAVAGVDLGIQDFVVTSDGEKIPTRQLRGGNGRWPATSGASPLPERLREAGEGQGQGRPRPPESPRLPHRLHRASAPRPRPRRDRARKPGRGEHGPQQEAGQGHIRLRVGHLPPHDRVQGGQVRAAPDLIGRFYQSKTCSACGHLLASLSLNTRHWTCPSCGTRHDRDRGWAGGWS